MITKIRDIVDSLTPVLIENLGENSRHSFKDKHHKKVN
jgi:hypothetical protein